MPTIPIPNQLEAEEGWEPIVREFGDPPPFPKNPKGWLMDPESTPEQVAACLRFCKRYEPGISEDFDHRCAWAYRGAKMWAVCGEHEEWRRPEYAASVCRLYREHFRKYESHLRAKDRIMMEHLDALQPVLDRKFKAWERTIQEKARTGQADLF